MTRDAVGDRQEGSRAIECTGIQDSMSTGAVDVHTQIELSFQDTPEDGSKPKKRFKMSPVFAELAGASDALLIGFQTLLEWGFKIFLDGDARPWATFETDGIGLPVEVPNRS